MEGTQEVFLARMNFVGHREAGKTSLATRLMGKEFQEDTQSTEGVAIHHIKSTISKSDLQGSAWEKKSLDPDELFKDFSHAILSLSMQKNQDDKPSEEDEGIIRTFGEGSSQETEVYPDQGHPEEGASKTGVLAFIQGLSQKITSGISEWFKKHHLTMKWLKQKTPKMP